MKNANESDQAHKFQWTNSISQIPLCNRSIYNGLSELLKFLIIFGDL